MAIQQGQIVANLIHSESVIINKVLPMGGMVSLSYTGVNSQLANTRVITQAQFEALEVIADEGSFDFGGDPVRFALFAEAERIHSAHLFDPLFAVNCSIVDPLPHQVEAVYKFLLPMPKIRFLLADDTGAGKTIMTGLLLKELMSRGLVERILIITPGGLTKQWQEDEMAVKFNIPFTLVNRSLFTADPNIFSTAQRVVASIDFISREDVLNVVGNTHWDMVVIDEAHKLSAYEYATRVYRSKRYEAAAKLAEQTEHLLLLTATPHRGRKDTFKKLLQLLDEDIFATEETASSRVKEYEKGGLNKFFIRRLKEDMKDWNGQPLFKNRFTKTVAYDLTPEEKHLYDEVTAYLTRHKEDAAQARNIHVSLALTVMQRRLVSSIYAIRRTLSHRMNALQGVVDDIAKNPALWQQRHKLEGIDVDDIMDYDELEDDEREALETILADPRKFKLFTTAKSLQELQDEAKEVKRLYNLANDLYESNQEERKYQKLKELLKSQNVIGGEKLVIFTEHKDTLNYLEGRLKNNGYQVATIHGGKTVDERRQAQWDFAKPETQILMCTDAAGEGINLQFCRLLINWDIPWNPNRLEQRMGRIHRYGQKQDVLVFNMVAGNTREGQVLERLLTKLDTIRESMGDDRVYDVIQDVLENVNLDAIIDSVLHGKHTALDDLLAQDTETLKTRFTEKIQEQRDRLAHSTVNYTRARQLKEESDEKRLQPIYVRLFFERALKQLGGSYQEIRPHIFRVVTIPESLALCLKQEYNLVVSTVQQLQFCFDKQVFLDYQNLGDVGKVLGKIHYINPGNPIFDSLVSVVRNEYRGDMLKGTVLISPEDSEEYLAFFVKSQLTDNRPHRRGDSIADERLLLVHQKPGGDFQITSPAKFLDLHPPTQFAKTIAPPVSISEDSVVQWSFEQITMPQLQETQERVQADADKRREYLETAFTQVILDLTGQIQELQQKMLFGDTRGQDKLDAKQQRIRELSERKQKRLRELHQMQQLAPKPPKVLGCAWVVPLSQVEYTGHYGMSRDDEAEAIAMATAMAYEESQSWMPHDVSANNEGYDIRSVGPHGLKRYLEVKGRSGSDGSVMLTENERNRLAQLGDTAWLYIVINCKSSPELFRIQNPANTMNFEQKSKGIQYFLPMKTWQTHLQATPASTLV
jgi:SNF2 family DNA or RNA helicase